VNALGNVVRGRSLLDPDLAHDLAACYRESPWVARVLHVRRVHPNGLSVALAIRKPFAVVERRSGPAIVLDGTGVRLPASADPEGCVRLSGATSPPPAPGRPWRDRRVADGLRVLAKYRSLVKSHSRLARFRAGEVRVREWSRAHGRPVVEIVSSAGFRVVWGIDLPSGEATLTEPASEVKLARLAEVLRSIAGSKKGVALLSLRQKSGVVVRFAEGEEDAG
jgi:hypothetical protein